VKRLRGAGDGPLVGIDQSAAGTAVVVLVEGQLVDKRFVADSISDWKRLRTQGALPPCEVRAGDEAGRTWRLTWTCTWVAELLGRWCPTHAALEDYALARQAFAHHLGEVGGALRTLLWGQGIPFRLYDVQAVKMFATGNGAAEKASVLMACRDVWGVDFVAFGRVERGAGGNLADAFAIAQLLRTELRLRAGEVTLEDLPDHQRKVFLRVTKANPVNMLARPFATLADCEVAQRMARYGVAAHEGDRA